MQVREKRKETLAPKNGVLMIESKEKAFVPDVVNHTWGSCALWHAVLSSALCFKISLFYLFFFFHFTYKAGCLEFVFWPSPVESSYMRGPTRVFFPLELMSCTWMTQTKTVEVK